MLPSTCSERWVYLDGMHRTLFPEITCAYTFFPSEHTCLVPTTNYHTQQTKTVRESRGGLAALLNRTNRDSVLSWLKHLCDISQRTPWRWFGKGKKAIWSFSSNSLCPPVGSRLHCLVNFPFRSREELASTSLLWLVLYANHLCYYVWSN